MVKALMAQFDVDGLSASSLSVLRIELLFTWKLRFPGIWPNVPFHKNTIEAFIAHCVEKQF